MTPSPFVTCVSATVPADREEELRVGFRELFAGPTPDGLLRSELLQGQDGRWSVRTCWRDREAVSALRRTGVPPAAAVLLQSVGSRPEHTLSTVAEEFVA